MMGALVTVWKTLSADDKLVFKPPSSDAPFVGRRKENLLPTTGLCAANPEVKPKETMTLMAAVWKTLTDEEKAIYQ